ncbi:Methyltransf_11 domain-containing protein [Cephalotus follicularis]|uniref:Methyltransf_11 domain-containing protein n=1 Tax=Cephalotus follicularis TaxID=3775 RepID=A0A1Q3B9V6_CEPFO|nr:Methyltransf_11 domain-containing protein [Cephalotus follicularis]
MDLKALKFKILSGSIARRVLLRAFMLASALSVMSLLHVLSGLDTGMFNTLTSHGCAVNFGSLNPFLIPIWGSFEPMQCKEIENLTNHVVSELMGMQMLTYDDRALCVGEGSPSAVMALQELGFPKAYGVYRHPFFSLKHKKFIYELDFDDNSFDFVFSRDVDKVSVPALLVLEIERVLRPGGVGAVLVGSDGLNPNGLIRSATPVSSLLKTSSVVHVGYVDGFTLVAFKKRIENVGYFEQYCLPTDCQSVANNKPFIEYIEPLVQQKPTGFGSMVAYLPRFMDISSRNRLVYIDIGAGKHLNTSVTNWFLPAYPVNRKAFNVYFVDHNTSVLLSYVKKPGITFVYHPGLAGNKATAKRNVDEDLDPYVAAGGFDFLAWFKEIVRFADFVVLKMNAGEEELKLLSQLFKSGVICSIDELFLHCSDHEDGKGVFKGSCIDLFKSLRSSGVFVHQWWGE